MSRRHRFNTRTLWAVAVGLFLVGGCRVAADQVALNQAKLTPQDHLRAVLEDRDPHSLWLLLARGTGPKILINGSDWMDVNITTARFLIETWSQAGDDYSSHAARFLKSLEIPRDRAAENAQRIAELKKKYPDAIVLKTNYFHIFSRADKRTTNELATRMDAVFVLYDSMFDFQEKIPYKSLIIFWRNRNEYYDHGAPANSAAYYSPDTKTLVGYNTKAMTQTQHMDAYQNMFHEGWHQYFDFYIPQAPRWFDEGFAQLFEPTDVKGRKAKMRRNAYRARSARQLLLDDKLIPLRQLIRMDYHEFYDPKNKTAAYSASYAFISFLMNFRSGDRQLEKQLRGFYKDYFWELRRGTDAVKAVDIVFGKVKLEVLEDLWKKSILRGR